MNQVPDEIALAVYETMSAHDRNAFEAYIALGVRDRDAEWGDRLWASWIGAVRAMTAPPSKEVEVWHYWPDCFIAGCWKCLWWDICWALADVGIEVKVPF